MNLKQIYFVIMCLLFLKGGAQISATDAEFEAQPIGIKDQLDYMMQTQLTLPKVILQPNYEERVIVFLNIDSIGRPVNLKFNKGLNNVVRVELIKVLNLMHFKRTLHLENEEAPYFLAIPLSTASYSKYKKQKQKPIVKSKLPIDTSNVVYNKADQSPEFYKDGEDGLKNFFLNELDYPKIAIQQSIEGTVLLDFIVEVNGYASNIDVKKGINGGCTEEAVRLIKQTRWQPAEKGGKLVRYKITYPVTFSLVNANKSTQVQTLGQ